MRSKIAKANIMGWMRLGNLDAVVGSARIFEANERILFSFKVGLIGGETKAM